MNTDFMIFALREGLKALLLITTPLMLIPMVVGLIISIIQAVTHIQDQILTFFPKFLIIILMIFFGAPYALSVMSTYFQNVLLEIPKFM